MKKLKKFWNEHENQVLILGTAFLFGTTVGALYIYNRDMEGMQVDAIRSSQLEDGSWAFGVKFRNEKQQFIHMREIA